MVRRHLAGVSIANLVVSFLLLPPALGDVITLNSGLQLKGRHTRISSLVENPLTKNGSSGAVAVKKIVLVDDGLRRTFVSTNQVRPGSVAPGNDIIETKIPIDKRVAKTARHLGTMGPILSVGPFDEFGNRLYSMQSSKGRLDIIQGITEITPVYTKLEGLQSKGAVSWDMRINTASIPTQTIVRVFRNFYRDKENAQERLMLVTLFLQAERYLDAVRELDQIIVDFPDLAEAQNQRRRLYQLVATDAIREINLRSNAGQHRQALALLATFPEKDVAGESLIKVKEMAAVYEKMNEQGGRIADLLDQHLELLSDHELRKQLTQVCQEIKNEMNYNNLGRMADYLRLADDDNLKPDQKIALAVSGWLLGNGEGIDNIIVAASLFKVRSIVREYLLSKHPAEREDCLRRLRELEGSTPSNLAKLISQMKPPIETDFSAALPSGTLEVTFPGLKSEEKFSYFVQLPPEYDPMRRYPCVVTLHGAGTTPLDQIDWWAGAFDPAKKLRLGQATRHGYIVLSPAWAEPHQSKYKYDLREHAVVVGALRDACRRFSIDTDRVFLSGHSMGGDAAWDIGLAHPDSWAGIIPIVATADKYIGRYWENGRGLPMYFVAGEMDGNRITKNSRDLDRYFRYPGFDTIYVEYQGRGHEHFHGEIMRIFDWMGRYRRDFFRREFECVTIRPWDKYFWWLELNRFPGRSLVLPINWPQKFTLAKSEAVVRSNNTIRVKTAASDVAIWLAPELVDFDKRITINGDTVDVKPDNRIVLEDVRTRGDRQHPFWAKVTPNVGRR